MNGTPRRGPRRWLGLGLLLAFLGPGGGAAAHGEDPAERGAVSVRLWLSGSPAPGVQLELLRLPASVGLEERLDPDEADRLLEPPDEAGPVIARASSGPDGRHRFDGLAAGRYRVRARLPSGAEATGSVTLPAPGLEDEVALCLRAGGERMAGHLRWADGRPFRGWVVAEQGPRRGWPGAGCAPSCAWAPTDEGGRFALQGLAAQPTSLSALEPGRLRTVLRLLPAPRDGLELVVDERLSREALTLLRPTGEPAAGIEVLASDGDPPTWCRTRTDAQGRAAVLRAPDGSLGVREERSLRAPEVLSLGPGQRVLETVPRPEVEGRVLDPEGAPLPGLTVWALGRVPLESARSTRSDDRGRYRLALPEADAELWAGGAGWAPSVPAFVSAATPRGSAAPLQRDLVALRAAPRRVRVLDPLGRPVPRARVRIEPEAGRSDRGGADPRGAFLRRLPLPGADADGIVEIGILPPGFSAALSASAPGFAPTRVELGASALEASLALNPRVRGRLLLPPGLRADDLVFPQRPPWAAWEGALDGDLGDVTRWVGSEATVWALGERSPLVGTAVVRPDGTVPVTLAPASLDAVWVLHLEDPSGAPIPQAHVTALWRGAHGTVDTRATAVRAGRVLIAAPAIDRRVRLSVSKPVDSDGRLLNLGPVRTGWLPPGEHRLVLAPGRRLAGRALASDGEPVPGVWVWLTAPEGEAAGSGERRVAVSGPEGRFELPGLAPLSYEVDASAPEGYEPPAASLLPVQASELTLRLVRHGSLRVRVLDESGEPVVGASVSLRTLTSERPFREGGLSRATDADGRARFPALAPGLLATLAVEPPQADLLGERRSPFSVPAPAGGEVLVRLSRAHALGGRVLHADGTPVPDASIWLRPDDEAAALPEPLAWGHVDEAFTRVALTDETGAFRVNGLPGRRLWVRALRVGDDGAVLATPAVVLVPGAGAEATLTLPPTPR